MKMKDIGRFLKTITEQADDPNSPDPFEPIPYTTSTDPIDREIAQLSAELAHTEAKLYSLSTKADIVRSQTQDGPAFSSNKRNTATSYFSGKKPVIVAGHAKLGTYIYDLSKFPPRVATWIQRYGPIYDKLESRKGTIIRKIKSLGKEKIAQQVTAAATQQNITTTVNQPSAASTIPIGQIPKKVQTGPGSPLIENPYFKSGEYAGPTSGYKFSTAMRNIYVIIESTLKRNGLSLGPLYVGRHGGVGGPINFITGTPGNKFVWRKYDAGGGSGQNWVYLNGHQMKTSSFVNMTDAQRDAALKVNNVI